MTAAAIWRLLAILALAAGSQAAPAAAEWTLVWSDEFEGNRIDPAKWGLDSDCWGGGNNERQCYTDSPANASVQNGYLSITARKQTTRGAALPAQQRKTAADAARKASKPFSSAKLTTRGKADWRYGRIEVRARLPEGQGTWPAIWMLPSEDHYGRWAASGEIDIMEAVNLGTPCATCPGGREDRILGTLHFGREWPGNGQKGSETHLPPSADEYHIFGIEWRADRIDWTLDGRVYATQTPEDWFSGPAERAPKGARAPFDRPFYLILNLAIGGGLPEGRNLGGVAPAGYPKVMQVDWVRVWRCPADSDPGKGC